MSHPTERVPGDVSAVPVPIAKTTAPGHSRPRKRPLWVLPAGLLAIVAVAVAVAIVVSKHDGTTAATNDVSTKAETSTTTNARTTPAPTAGETTLQSRVPASFASTCGPAEGNRAVVGASDHISCTDDHLDIDYYLFPSRSSLDAYWRTARTTKAAVAGTCRDDMHTTLENYYQGVSNTRLGGQLLCYHALQAAHIQWQQPNQLIVATAAFSGNNQGMAHGHLVQEWRADDLGPRQDPKKAVVRHPCGSSGCMGMTP